VRICYLANASSVHTQRWARYFSDRGDDVTVLSFGGGVIDGVAVIPLYSRFVSSRFKILSAIGKIRRLIKKINPDILHAHYATSYGLAGALAGKRPLVVTAWGTDVLVMPEKSWVYRQIVRFVLNRADLVTSMAPHMTEHLVKRGYARDDKIINLPFGVDTSVFNLKKRTKTHGNQPDIVVSTRRPDYGMDVDNFVRAIPAVLKVFERSRFIITGEGPLRESIMKLAADLAVANHIEFRGEISHPAMPDLLGGADVFVSTSPTDGNNISLNEAMSCGTFPVVTDIPANRAWIQPGENGLVYPCGDADQLAARIIEALRHPDWRNQVMSRNWEIIRTQASWSNSMEEITSHYHRLIHENRGRKAS
jgi:L-malate glycosyltransferase